MKLTKQDQLESHIRKVNESANKWVEWEKKECELKLRIAELEIQLNEAKKQSTRYSRQTKGLALLEVI